MFSKQCERFIDRQKDSSTEPKVHGSQTIEFNKFNYNPKYFVCK